MSNKNSLDNKIRVLEISKSILPNLGGIEVFIKSRIKLYEDFRFFTTILTTNRESKKQLLAYNESCLPVIRLKSFSKYYFTPGLIKINFDDYDIISINQIGKFLSDYSLLRNFRSKKKLVLTPFLDFHSQEHIKIKRFFKKFIIPTLIQIPDTIICLTEFEKSYWKTEYGVDENKLVVIPPYIENIMNHISKERSSDDILLYIGRYDMNKRIDLLVNLFNSVNISNRIQLTVSNKDVSIYPVSNKIEFLGNITEKQKDEVLANCSALIYPSDYESFGLVLLEASCYMKPIICSDIPVFREILDERGVLFFQNKIDSIKEKVDLFNSFTEEKKSEMGKINYENLRRFSYDIVKKKYKELFDKMLS